MNTRNFTPLLFSGLLVAAFAIQAKANIFSDNFDALAVAERAKAAPAELSKPTSYVAFDGGYIEAGDPIAGDEPPTADNVRQSLEAALASQGFQASQTVPSLLITYHWGVLRVDHREINVPYKILTNLMARISLVSTAKMEAEIENHILDRKKGGGEDLSVSSPRFLAGDLDAALSHSRQPRIFVVVSAYDFQSLFQKHEARLVWSTKLSTQETSGKMEQVIPPLLSKGSSFLGADSPNVANIQATLEAKSTAIGISAGTPPTPESYHIDRLYLDSLLRQERAQISGEPNNP